MRSYRQEFKEGWTIVMASIVGVAFGITALPFYTLGVFVKPVSAEFGWGREAVQWGFAAQMFGLALVGWIYGGAVDRHGARRIALLSQIGLGLSLVALALTSSLAHWYIGWLLIAFLGAGTSPITWTRGISDWFDAGRGAALGLGLLGSGLTGLFAPPLVAGVIAAYGWRAGYAALGASVIVIALPLVWLLFKDRRMPAPVGRGRVVLDGIDRKTALRDYRFWVMLVVFALVTFAVGGLIPNLVPMLTDRGISQGEATGYASLAGLAVIVGRVGAGFLLDRFWAPAVALVFLMLPAIACLTLWLGSDSPVLLGLSAALIGLAAGAEFDLVAYMASRYFGMRHYGFIYAIQMVGMLFFGGLGPPVFGRIYDSVGSYDPALLIAGGIFVVTPLLLLTMGRYPAAQRPVITA